MPTYAHLIRQCPYAASLKTRRFLVAEFRNQFIGTVIGRLYVSSCNYNPVDKEIFVWFVLIVIPLGAVGISTSDLLVLPTVIKHQFMQTCFY